MNVGGSCGDYVFVRDKKKSDIDARSEVPPEAPENDSAVFFLRLFPPSPRGLFFRLSLLICFPI